MTSFYLLWFAFLFASAILAIVLARAGGADGSVIWGLVIGFALVGLATVLVTYVSVWVWVMLAAAGIALALIRLQLAHDRQVNKWVNGRPRNED